jgi:hypothetical protein
MKKNDYYTMGTEAARAAAAGITDEQLTGDLMKDKGYISALAESTALACAEQHGVKKTTATFFDSFRSVFTRTVTERQDVLRQAAKPVFWGTDDTRRTAFEGSDVRVWTLVSQMDGLKSTRREIVEALQSLVRDAQSTLARVTAQDESKAVNDKLYPIYDENLGRMGMRADMAVMKLRMLQEATRAMVTLTGMRLPSRDELVAAGLRDAEEGQ